MNLRDHVDGKIHVLIAPLEILSSMEEAIVREKAVNCLMELTENQDKSIILIIYIKAFFENHFF